MRLDSSRPDHLRLPAPTPHHPEVAEIARCSACVMRRWVNRISHPGNEYRTTTQAQSGNRRYVEASASSRAPTFASRTVRPAVMPVETMKCAYYNRGLNWK